MATRARRAERDAYDGYLPPAVEDARYQEARRVGELSTGYAPRVLHNIPWTRRRDVQGAPVGMYPGVGEVQGTAATALINDFMNEGIAAQIRLNERALGEMLKDPHRPVRGSRVLYEDAADPGRPTGIEIEGPHPQDWLPTAGESRNFRRPQAWKLTTEWQEIPAFIAYWFWYMQHEDPRLGAAYNRTGIVKETIDGVESVEKRPVPMPSVYARLHRGFDPVFGDEATVPAMLVECRMACEGGAVAGGVIARADGGAPDNAAMQMLLELRARVDASDARAQQAEQRALAAEATRDEALAVAGATRSREASEKKR